MWSSFSVLKVVLKVMAPDLRFLVFFYPRSEKGRGGKGEKREEKGDGKGVYVAKGQVPIGHAIGNCNLRSVLEMRHLPVAPKVA